MPPHCDTMDGPVVTAAREALETENINLILAYVPESNPIVAQKQGPLFRLGQTSDDDRRNGLESK